jgi:hypothetical protein
MRRATLVRFPSATAKSNSSIQYLQDRQTMLNRSWQKAEAISWKGIDGKEKWELKAMIYYTDLELDRLKYVEEGANFNQYAYRDVPGRIQDLTCSVKLQ